MFQMLIHFLAQCMYRENNFFYCSSFDYSLSTYIVNISIQEKEEKQLYIYIYYYLLYNIYTLIIYIINYTLNIQ